MANDFLFTSESVTEGHPDKVCDQISDAVLDECLRQDPTSRVACEVMLSNKKAIIAGEITTEAKIDYKSIAIETIKNIGYDDKEKGLDYADIEVIDLINKQSSDISYGISSDPTISKELGAGDQGLMFGYANDETSNFMPMPIHCAHNLAQNLALYRKQVYLDYLRPDGKTQVTVEYRNNQPYRIHTIVISTQHNPDVSQEQIRSDMIELAKKTLPSHLLDDKTIFHINPTGRFVLGGPASDCGVTGRKIIVDSYGGMGRHGGGAFSGKDPSKVDRSAAYAARYIAKNIVAAEIAQECEIQLAYAIGFSSPISININTFGTSTISETTLAQLIIDKLPLSPKWMIETFNLLRPQYLQTATYGHFGKEDHNFMWEKTNMLDELHQMIKDNNFL